MKNKLSESLFGDCIPCRKAVESAVGADDVRALLALGLLHETSWGGLVPSRALREHLERHMSQEAERQYWLEVRNA